MGGHAVKRWVDLGREAVARLNAAGLENASREVTWLIEEVTGSARSGADDAAPREGEHFERLVARRMAGEPLQYVIGHWPFRSLDLLVDRRALIPRPETEQVAEVALAKLRNIDAAEPIVVDLGLGTGALALSVATEHPTAKVWGVEHAAGALALARENLALVGADVSRVNFVLGSWFAPLPEALRGCVDLIVTNPPYVATGDELDDSVRAWEPAAALFAGEDGLDDLRMIISDAPRWLSPDGVLVAEIGADQADAVVALARGADFTNAEIRTDLVGRHRILVAHVS